MYEKATSCGEIGSILHEIYFKFCDYKKNGIFIEIGANDGKTGSFTYNLAKMGWIGIYCEPVPRIYQKCVNNHINHKNVTVLKCAIGEKKEIGKIVDGNTLSTMDEETLSIYKCHSWSKGCFVNNGSVHEVNVETLDTILEKYKIRPNFDILIIDVEGYEEKVLNGFSINKYKPKIIVIEIPDQHKDFINKNNAIDKFKNLRQYFINNNYFLLVNDIVDNVYIRNDLIDDTNKDYKKYCSKIIKFKQFNHI